MELQNETLTIQIEPTLGGKLAQIIDRRAGRHWLARHPRLAWRALNAAELARPDAYTRYADLGGWDECCPTVGCSRYPLPPFAGQILPDHGECWSQSPECVYHDSSLEHIWRGAALPFELRRRIALAPDRPQFTLAYSLQSLTQDNLALLWSAHPLFAIEPGMRLELPPGIPVTVASTGSPLGPQGTRFDWPICRNLDLSQITPEAGWAVKLFTDGIDPGAATLVASTGEQFHLEWASGKSLLRLGMWLNYTGWSGDGGNPLQNIGLEPCIGMPDILEQAIQANMAWLLAPTEKVAWQLEGVLS